MVLTKSNTKSRHMPIYDISESKDIPEVEQEAVQEETPFSKKDRFFSSLTARLLFFVLLLADLVWLVYTLAIVSVVLSLSLLTFFKVEAFQKSLGKRWIALKRSFVCALALGVSLFSPALGIMVACTYFLMYDKMGIKEVVPTSLQDQFQEFVK